MKQKATVLGIDLAKRVFHVVGMDDAGHVVLKKRLTREALLPFIAQLSPAIIGLEACGGAHDWARRFRGYGHTVQLIAPQFVKPYVKSHKNDPADAEAICEAVMRPTMRFVPMKEVEQQDLQSLHRARERGVKARTAFVNAIRGLGMEYGFVFPHSVTKFRHTFAATLEAEQDKLTPLSAELFRQLYDEFGTLDKRLAYYNEKIAAIGAAHPVCQRLETIPGLGPLTATALVAAVSDARHLKHGRQFAAWLGLVPRQHSTGGTARVLGIRKRGDVYLRTLLVHGARAPLRWVGLKTDRRSQWVRGLVERRGKKKAAVAVANKNARMVWALLMTEQEYTAEHAAA